MAPPHEASGTPPWLTQGAPLHITPKTRADAYASRRFPATQPPPDAAQAWARAREDLRLAIDLQASDAALQPVAGRVLARDTPSLPAPDAEADALLLAVVDYSVSKDEQGCLPALVQYLVARYGLVDAVGIYLAALRLQVESSGYDHDAKCWRWRVSSTVTQAAGYCRYGAIGEAEETLREQLSMAPEAEWQRCAGQIEASLPGLYPSRQARPALLLPERPELAHALGARLADAPDADEAPHWLLLVATDPAAIAQAAALRPSHASLWSDRRMTATVLLERGVDAVAVLAFDAGEAHAGEALAAIGTPEAVTALARVAGRSKPALARLALALDRWPQAALVALARLVAAGGKDAGLLEPGLARLLRAHGGLVDGLRPWLDAAAQAAIDRRLAPLADPHTLAEADELPQVLAAPPWLAKPRKKAAGVLALDTLPLAPLERWAPGAREQALRLGSWYRERHDRAAQDPDALLDELGFGARGNRYGEIRRAAAAAIGQRDAQGFIAARRAMLAERAQEDYSWFRLGAHHMLLLPPELALPFWNDVAGEAVVGGDLAFAMASLGLPALPGLLSLVHARPAEGLALALHYGALELAAPAARAFAQRKTLRAQGRAWLLAFPEHAACGLMPVALGRAGEARDCAGTALRLLQAEGHGASLLEVAGRYGDTAVAEALHAVLNESPLDRFPSKRVSLPAFWQPRGWRRPALRNGKALPDAALEHLGQMLTFPSTEEIYGGIAVVKEACKPDTLADFAWDAFSAWLEAGAPSKEGWALTALGWFGNDDTARRLTPLIRAWPGESAHARAVAGLEVLAVIGSDVALMLLHGIAQKLKFKGLQDKAREKIDAIAEARGLSTEELEDRLAPDLGLDAQGTLRLDFGPRAFVVGFDETLKPYVRELDDQGRPGARLPDLPKAKKTDDAALSKDAAERFKLLKKDVRTIASQQLLRLEVAMCTRRRWTPAVFRMFLAEHPLLRHLAQRLVWGVYAVPGGESYGGTLQACFRVAEDGSFSTAADEPFDLPATEGLQIGVPHALELQPADAATFGQVLADYELLQPFAQLGRDTYRLTDAEQAADKLERWKGAKVPTGRVLGLVNKGWRRGAAQDGGAIWCFYKPLGAHKVIALQLEPGIIVGMVDEHPEQTLGGLKVGAAGSWGEIDTPERFAALDAIAASELVRDLEALRA